MSKQDAQTIRTTIKNELGLSAKQVSVRTSRGGSIRVEIKDPTANYRKVEEIANRQERIHRDGYGEILSGGNTFVFVSWSTAAREERALRYLHEVEHAISELEAAGRKSTILVPITDEVMIGFDQPGYGYRLWNNGSPGMHVNTAECAAAIAADYVDGF